MHFPILNFPIGVLEGDTLFVVPGPTPLIGADGIVHHAGVWASWSAEDWATHRPTWRFIDIVDAPPAAGPYQTLERRPDAEWTLDREAGTVTVDYSLTDWTAEQLAGALSIIQRGAIERVNREAGMARAAYMTITPGQEGTYQAKQLEARAFIDDAKPAPARYPYLAAEATYTGATLAAIAALVNATAEAWTAVNAEIEGRRRGTLVAIDGATTIEEVDALFPVAWPTPA